MKTSPLVLKTSITHPTSFLKEPDMFPFVKEVNKENAGNCLKLNNLFGNGFYFSIVMEPGLSVRTWVCSTEKTVHLNLSPQPAIAQKQVCFIGILTPGEMLFINEDSDKSKGFNNLHEFISYTGNFELNGTVTGGQRVKIIQILMDEAWLTDQCVGITNCQYQQICKKISSADDLSLWKVDAPEAYHSLLKQFFDVVEHGMSFSIMIKSKAFALLDFIFHQMISKSEVNKVLLFDAGDSNIAFVEFLILNNLSKKLPPIKDIAKNMAMSESTLKRKFKKSYGNSIYDFYLAKKMELARKLITEDGLQVSEVAYSLSYEKVSHFIEVFKKYYKHSPGKYKKM